MRELVYYVAVSLDGFIAAEDGSFDMFDTTGDHMATITGEYADAVPSFVHEQIGISAPGTMFDTVIQGWNSYAAAFDVGIERPYAHLTEIVATRGGRRAVTGVEFTDDPLATVQELKAQSGLGIYLCGGGELAGTLIEEIDRLILKRYPVVLGAGVPLFGRPAASVRRFDLVRSRPYQSGVVIDELVRVR